MVELGGRGVGRVVRNGDTRSETLEDNITSSTLG